MLKQTGPHRCAHIPPSTLNLYLASSPTFAAECHPLPRDGGRTELIPVLLDSPIRCPLVMPPIRAGTIPRSPPFSINTLATNDSNSWWVVAMVNSFILPWGTRYLTQSTSIRPSRRMLPQSNQATIWFSAAFYTIIWDRAPGVSGVHRLTGIRGQPWQPRHSQTDGNSQGDLKQYALF